jgi:hypothetical protein
MRMAHWWARWRGNSIHDTLEGDTSIIARPRALAVQMLAAAMLLTAW